MSAKAENAPPKRRRTPTHIRLKLCSGGATVDRPIVISVCLQKGQPKYLSILITAHVLLPRNREPFLQWLYTLSRRRPWTTGEPRRHCILWVLEYAPGENKYPHVLPQSNFSAKQLSLRRKYHPPLTPVSCWRLMYIVQKWSMFSQINRRSHELYRNTCGQYTIDISIWKPPVTAPYEVKSYSRSFLLWNVSMKRR